MKAKMKRYMTKDRIEGIVIGVISIVAVGAMTYWFMWELTEKVM